MADVGSPGQKDKKDAEQRTEQVRSEQAGSEKARNEAKSAAELSSKLPPEEASLNPYPNYDFMPLEELRSLAAERGVEMNRDVEKAHLISELRAADSGTLSATTRHGAR